MDDDYYSQPGALYRLMRENEKSRLVANLVVALNSVRRDIQLRQIRHFHRADPEYGSRVAEGLGITLDNRLGKAA